MKTEKFHAKFRCNLNDISYLSEMQKNNFQILIITTSFVILSSEYFSKLCILKIAFLLVNNVSRI